MNFAHATPETLMRVEYMYPEGKYGAFLCVQWGK